MGYVNGTFVTEVDGVEYYTDGVKHSGSSFSANIAFIDYSREYDQIIDTGERWSQNFGPVVKVDRMKKVTIQNEETKEPFAGIQSQGCA